MIRTLARVRGLECTPLVRHSISPVRGKLWRNSMPLNINRFDHRCLADSAPNLMMKRAYEALHNEFKLKSFRSLQEAVIKRLLVDGLSTLVVMPTGSGKSLCYQIPALCLDGLTLVISPLLALMKDQVDALNRKGVSASRLDSSQSKEEHEAIMASVLTGETKLLYVTPERLESPRFIRLMKQTKISLLAIDESHCITEWGRSFRAAYSRIPRFAKKCNVERFLCLTATPTRQSIEEICQSFSIDKGGILRAPLHRPNLDYNIVVVGSSDDEPGRNVWILNKYRENPGQTLIYTRLRGQAMVLAHFLCSNGIQAKAYHAGLTKREREKIQDWFMKSPNAVICSTVAFGMGIDHPTVRHVFHHDPPSTLQGYAQETGRAGRDGRGANCTMLISARDRSHAVNFPRGDTPSQKSIQSILARLVGTASSKFRTNIDKRRWQFRFNIRGGALSHLINQLSDKYGLIRIEDPVYDTAVFKLSEYLDTTFPSIKLDTSHASRIIQRRMEDQKSEEESVYHIDIPTLASENKFSRYLLTDTLHTWSDNGWIILRKNPRSDSFKLLKPPLEDTDIDSLMAELYQNYLAEERLAVRQREEFFDWVASTSCLPKGLVLHFGDVLSFPNFSSRCGRCTVCTSGNAVPISYPPQASKFNEMAFQAVLSSIPAKDDARLMACFACGIVTPQMKSKKWSNKRKVFGMMRDHSYEEVLQRCQDVVKSYRG